jgi:hypothetical protein
MLTQHEFFTKMHPYAVLAAKAVGGVEASLVPVILAQWDVESGRESLTWVGHLNYAGITDGGPPNFLQFDSLLAFTCEYVRTLQNGYYEQVLDVARQGRPPAVVARALAASPWDAGHYGGDGSILLERLIFYVGQVPTTWPEQVEAARQTLMAAGVTDGTRGDHSGTRAEVWVMITRALGVRL